MPTEQAREGALPQVTIGDRSVGGIQPCLIVAEAGVNHNGSVALAHRLVDIAAACDADAVKFQTFEPSQLVSAHAGAAPYQHARGALNQADMLRGLTLPADAWKELADHARERGLLFLSTAFDAGSLQTVLELGVPALKVASGDLTNLPFIRLLAATGLPMIISTGLGTLDEVEAAVGAAEEAPSISLLHCVTAYPTPTGSSNLKAIVTIRDRFDVPVGWSDHTEGALTALGAVSLGACVLEKHLTTDRGLPGPDHQASAAPEDFADYVRQVRELESALGDGLKRPQQVELPNRMAARRSYHARRAIAAGTVLTNDDVELLRPEVGLPPSTQVVGRTLARSLGAGDAVQAEDLA